MRLIVGLGNPGREYAGTRHNVGFDVVDELARRWQVRLKPWKSVAELVRVPERDAVLVEPQTFMNASGEAVQKIAAFFDVVPGDILVIVDEVQLPLGRVRLRRSGSAGGHNGLKSVIQHVGDGFPRLRIGIERGDRRMDLANRVLSRFTTSERPAMEHAVERAADAVETFVADGIEAAMSRFNRSDEPAEEAGAGRGTERS